MQNRTSSNVQGIDISSYQAGLDMKAVKAAGITVVYIKATQNLTYVNPYLQAHYQQAKAQGLKVGFYHYFIAGVDAEQQAQYFIKAIQGLTYDCLPALDVEETKGYSAEALSGLVHTCLNEIAYLTGYKPLLYTYTYFAKSSLVANYVNMYPLWIADYNGKSAPSNNPIWDTWVGFQYSSLGKIGGIIVDLDEFTANVFLDVVAYNSAIAKLVAAKMITSGDYWLDAIASNTSVRGDWMALVIERMTGKSTLAEAVAKLVTAGVIGSPEYWLSNCVVGGTVEAAYVKILITRAVSKLNIGA
ncbi:MAG TPA: GH25 family lysozyme [Syntrophomonadaceae bacterium]|nr:GH25 family lysozyme [Syntrophomonadaceae bacterium]